MKYVFSGILWKSFYKGDACPYRVEMELPDDEAAIAELRRRNKEWTAYRHYCDREDGTPVDHKQPDPIEEEAL